MINQCNLQRMFRTRRGHYHQQQWRTYLTALAALLAFNSLITSSVSTSSSSSSSSAPELCSSGPVESAAEVVFADGVRRLFLSSGPYYWLLNATSDRPDKASAATFPNGFQPDVALLRNMSACYRDDDRHSPVSLVLLQMKSKEDGTEVEWLTLEVNLGDWWSATEKINGTDQAVADPQLHWGTISKIAQCDIVEAICFKTSGGKDRLTDYFATMSFDFKRKLDSAFGTLGETAYFVQDKSLYKVVYKSQCISNPYLDVVAYPSVDIATSTTAAVFTNFSSTVIFFDGDVHLKIANASSVVADETLLREQLTDLGCWQENGHYLFEQCPLVEAAWFSFLFDLNALFSSSKKHFAKRKMVLVSSASLLLALFLLFGCCLLFGLLKRRRKRRGTEKVGGNGEGGNGAGGEGDANGGEQLMGEQLDIVEMKTGGAAGGDSNGEQAKTLLQTSC